MRSRESSRSRRRPRSGRSAAGSRVRPAPAPVRWPSPPGGGRPGPSPRRPIRSGHRRVLRRPRSSTRLPRTWGDRWPRRSNCRSVSVNRLVRRDTRRDRRGNPRSGRDQGVGADLELVRQASHEDLRLRLDRRSERAHHGLRCGEHRRARVGRRHPGKIVVSLDDDVRPGPPGTTPRHVASHGGGDGSRSTATTLAVPRSRRRGPRAMGTGRPRVSGVRSRCRSRLLPIEVVAAMTYAPVSAKTSDGQEHHESSQSWRAVRAWTRRLKADDVTFQPGR